MINDICNYLNRLKPFNCTGHSLPLTGDFFSTFVSPLSPLKRKSVPVIKLSLMSSLTIIILYNKCADKKKAIFLLINFQLSWWLEHCGLFLSNHYVGKGWLKLSFVSKSVFLPFSFWSHKIIIKPDTFNCLYWDWRSPAWQGAKRDHILKGQW